MIDFIHAPEDIENLSFKLIRKQTDLSGFVGDQTQIAMRMVHTCGDPKVISDLRFSNHAITAGTQSIAQAQPILCDVEMVRHGISKRLFNRDPMCFLNAQDVPAIAKKNAETRSMAALSHWPEHLANSIVLIGNAPTALFRLLEMLNNGAAKPALIIGMPVGFVGAAESKQVLIDQAPCDYITLTGQRGGSALAASVINALARVQLGIRY